MDPKPKNYELFLEFGFKTVFVTSSIVKEMTEETPEVRSYKRKPREKKER